MSVLETTRDRFLGGRVVADQPKDGFRAGHDTVLVAAAVPAKSGERVLELGSGTGIASLCLACRVPELSVLGIDIDAPLVRFANENAVRNGMESRVHFRVAEASEFRDSIGFDHVFFNPPFHPASTHISGNAARARAKRGPDDTLVRWTRAALDLVRPGGTVTAILRADRTEEIVAAMAGHAISVFPLFPRAGEVPKRAIVRIVKGTAAPLRTLAGLALHKADGRNTEAAEAVLRHGEALALA